MEIVLNGEKEVLEQPKTITQLLEGLDMNPGIVTVSLNEKILPKEDFDQVLLAEGDKVDILLFMGGGA